MTGAFFSVIFGDSPERTTVKAIWKAFLQLPRAVSSRWRARALAVIGDTEAFDRPMGGYFRDRFVPLPADPDPLRVLFVSPYPICPPVHGGGVFMLETSRQLAKLSELHLIVLLDHAHERSAHDALVKACASAAFLVRMGGASRVLGSIVPHAVREFTNDDLRWLIHRQIYLQEIDVIQLEYLPMGQYFGTFRRLACVLFEHDIYFQSIARALPTIDSMSDRLRAMFEYLRSLRYELQLLPRFDSVQVCSPANAAYIASFLPQLEGRIDDGNRAVINSANYTFTSNGREADTMLFLGSFRHQPNVRALAWFANEILPRILAIRPQAKLVVVGSDPPPRHFLPDSGSAIEFRGFVADVREPLSRYSVFVCPILSGSGMRVKLLEAFAAGIPVVSTRLGAEGLAEEDGRTCALADEPETFARRVVDLLGQPGEAAAMAQRAREEVAAKRDATILTARLVEGYRTLVRTKRSGEGSGM